MRVGARRDVPILVRLAPAKVNLSLDVLGERPDGYHDVRTIMQTVSLFDRLTFRAADRLTVESPIRPLEADLVWRAAHALEARGFVCPVHITVTKEIPEGAGLGGGSSDAAQTLLGLVDFLRLPLSLGDLIDVARGIGSDVPFFLEGGSALVEGRGEMVHRLRPIGRHRFLILKPRASLMTREVFAHALPGDGSRTERLLASLHESRLILAGNDLEAPARALLPSLDRLFQSLEGVDAQMTGSGSAVFVHVTDREAEPLLEHWRGHLFARLVETVDRVEEFRDGRANAMGMGRQGLAY